MPYCMNMWNLYTLFMDPFLFSGFNRFMHFLSTYANSWIKIAARRTLFDPVWFPVGIRRWVGPGMALTTIGEVPQWGGVHGWLEQLPYRCRLIIRQNFENRENNFAKFEQIISWNLRNFAKFCEIIILFRPILYFFRNRKSLFRDQWHPNCTVPPL